MLADRANRTSTRTSNVCKDVLQRATAAFIVQMDARLSPSIQAVPPPIGEIPAHSTPIINDANWDNEKVDGSGNGEVNAIIDSPASTMGSTVAFT